MTPLTLPGTIPGLLRRCAPVIDSEGHRGTVTYLSGEVWCVDPTEGSAYDGETPVGGIGDGTACGGAGWHLDLTDPVGRWMAAVWAIDRVTDGRITSAALWIVVGAALRGHPMTDAEITTLRDGCMALAGVTT